MEACKLHWEQAARQRDPLTQEEILKAFAIDFCFNTTSIEGNTITLKQASLLLTEQRTPSGKTLREIHDLKNTERVFLGVFESIGGISHESIIDLHRELLKDVDSRFGYRTSDVHVIRASFESTPAPYIRADMDILLKWYREHQEKIHPLALAGIVHHKFEKIHPFFDGNGRTGRMLLNIILIQAGYPPLIVRNRHREEYLSALKKADKAELTQSPPDAYRPLIEFLAEEYMHGYWDHFL